MSSINPSFGLLGYTRRLNAEFARCSTISVWRVLRGDGRDHLRSRGSAHIAQPASVASSIITALHFSTR